VRRPHRQRMSSAANAPLCNVRKGKQCNLSSCFLTPQQLSQLRATCSGVWSRSSPQAISHELDLSTTQSTAIVLFCLSRLLRLRRRCLTLGKVAARHYPRAKALMKRKVKQKKKVTAGYYSSAKALIVRLSVDGRRGERGGPPETIITTGF